MTAGVLIADGRRGDVAVLSGGDFLLSTFEKVSGEMVVVSPWWGDAIGPERVKVRIAAKHSTTHKTVLLPAQQRALWPQMSVPR